MKKGTKVELLEEFAFVRKGAFGIITHVTKYGFRVKFPMHQVKTLNRWTYPDPRNAFVYTHSEYLKPIYDKS